MNDPLTSDALMQHIRALAEGIGPRPAGHLQEAEARRYIRHALREAGITEVERMPLTAWDTWGYTLIAPALLTLLGNGMGALGPAGWVAGAMSAFFAAHHLHRSTAGGRQPLAFLFPRRETANLIVRLPPRSEVRHRVVLIGHTDTNKHRFTFAPSMKHLLRATATAAELLLLLNGALQLARAVGAAGWLQGLHRATVGAIALTLPYLLGDERGGYIPGAADNASAVACLLGLGAQLRREPLERTEVWLLFSAAEEVGCLGMHAFLDRYGEVLRDAWFLDFEMVSTPRIAYVTRHSSLSYLNAYAPDPESLAWAARTARRHPELGVEGRPVVIVEEVGSLRGRGFRALGLVGVDEEGWLANWHRLEDDLAHLDPEGTERAARFALAMLRLLDEEDGPFTPSEPL